jgi:hypothetical protein
MRRPIPLIAGVLLAAGAVACDGDSGASTKDFCADVRELRRLGREPGSVEPVNPQQLGATITGLRQLERSAPADIEDDVKLIRETLQTIAELGEGKRVDPKKVEQLAENDEKIRDAGKDIDREVGKCGIAVPPT